MKPRKPPIMEFDDDAYRISANLAQVYAGLREARQLRAALPRYMTWRTVNETRYLYSVGEIERSLGREDEHTTLIYDSFVAERDALDESITETTLQLDRLAAQYRALKLPQLMSLPAKILQELDLANRSDDFLVVGSCAFPAYEVEAGQRFMQGVDATLDFDLSWKPDAPSGVIQLSVQQPTGLYDILLRADKSFKRSMFAGHKVRNKSAFEVDVLCSRGDIFRSEVEARSASFGGNIEPLEMDGQDILHLGEPISHVVVGRDGTAAPLRVPDPRCMMLHKLWLSSQADRPPQKRNKDEKQALALHTALERMPRLPFDEEFIASLPERWQKLATQLYDERKSGLTGMQPT